MVEYPDPNLVLLEQALVFLGDLSGSLIFVGGMATGLLITDPAAPPIRVTQDVDVVVEVADRNEYYDLANALKRCGFREDVRPDAPVCRWVQDSVTLDVMPTDRDILGFGNSWYPLVAQTAQQVSLPSGRVLWLIAAPCFLATKLEAFTDRGGGDYVLSHDLEDLIAVLDGRPGIVEEVRKADPQLKSFLAGRFTQLLADDAFRESLPGQLPPDLPNQQRLPGLIRRIQAIVEMI